VLHLKLEPKKCLKKGGLATFVFAHQTSNVGLDFNDCGIKDMLEMVYLN